MKLAHCLRFTLVIVSVSYLPVKASPYYVNGNTVQGQLCGNDGACNGSSPGCYSAGVAPNCAKRTIQGGLSVATNAGDVVHVAPGTYTGTGNRDIQFTKDVRLTCDGAPWTCVVDCQTGANCGSPSQPGFKFDHAFSDPDLGRNTILEGFTIFNCKRAVLISQTSPTIRNCRFLNNCGNAVGGAIYTQKVSSPLIENCLFIDNTANAGGAIYFSHAGDGSLDQYHPEIRNCIVGTVSHPNRATNGGGGGLYMTDRGWVTISNTRFEGNTSTGEGGAIRVVGDDMRLEIANCTITKNSVVGNGDDGGGIAVLGSQTPEFAGTTDVMNSLIVGNTAARGGGIFTGRPNGESCCRYSKIHLVNSVLYGNTGSVTNGGHEVYFSPDESPTLPASLIQNSIVWKTAATGKSVERIAGSLTIEESDVKDLSSLSGITLSDNIASDPLFIDPDGADNTLGTPDDNFRIYNSPSASPCKDAADQALRLEDFADLDGNENLNELTPLDLGLYARVIGSEVDIGAYEIDVCSTDAECGENSDPCDGDEKCENAHCIIDLDDCNLNGTDDDCELAAIVDWKSILSHGPNNPIGLLVGADSTFSESRNSGVTKLRLSFSSPIDPMSVSASNVVKCGKDVNGQAVDLSGITVTTSVLSDNMGVDINFSPKLPNYARYRVRLNGVEDLACHTITTGNERIFTSLFGDASGDRRVNVTDIGGVRGLNPTSPIDPQVTNQVRSDLDDDNDVDSTDESLVYQEYGKDARYITDPSCP